MKKVMMQAALDLAKCTGCGTCAHVCPTTAYAFPTERPLRREKHPPCNLSCPAEIDVEGVLALLKQDRWQQAAALLRAANPFPGLTGRLCPAPCERACNRGRHDFPLAIKTLEQALAREPWAAAFPPARQDARVAVVGAGLAGLACAFHLLSQGLPVTIFEAETEVGGALRQAVAAGQLERELLDRELSFLQSPGVELRLGQRYGQDFGLEDLAGFAAVYLATGAGEAAGGQEAISADRWGRTSNSKVLAGGALAGAGKNLAQAIGSGARGATAILALLGGEPLAEVEAKKPVAAFSGVNLDYHEPVATPPAARLADPAPQAGACVAEAGRCFACGVTPIFDPASCRGCTNCSSRCPHGAISLVELAEPYTVRVVIDPHREEEIKEICLRAKLNPESIVCYCNSTRAGEIAAALLQGAKSPEEVSRLTGARTGCSVLCIEPIFRLMLAAGLELGAPPQSDVWYPAVPTLYDLPAATVAKYAHRGFHFEEDKAFLQKYLADRADA